VNRAAILFVHSRLPTHVTLVADASCWRWIVTAHHSRLSFADLCTYIEAKRSNGDVTQAIP